MSFFQELYSARCFKSGNHCLWVNGGLLAYYVAVSLLGLLLNITLLVLMIQRRKQQSTWPFIAMTAIAGILGCVGTFSYGGFQFVYHSRPNYHNGILYPIMCFYQAPHTSLFMTCFDLLAYAILLQCLAQVVGLCSKRLYSSLFSRTSCLGLSALFATITVLEVAFYWAKAWMRSGLPIRSCSFTFAHGDAWKMVHYGKNIFVVCVTFILYVFMLVAVKIKKEKKAQSFLESLQLHRKKAMQKWAIITILANLLFSCTPWVFVIFKKLPWVDTAVNLSSIFQPLIWTLNVCLNMFLSPVLRSNWSPTMLRLCHCCKCKQCRTKCSVAVTLPFDQSVS